MLFIGQSETDLQLRNIRYGIHKHTNFSSYYNH